MKKSARTIPARRCQPVTTRRGSAARARRLAVSNIAWPREAHDRAVDLLCELGVEGLEIAPLNVFSDWSPGIFTQAARLRQRLGERGLCRAGPARLAFRRGRLRLVPRRRGSRGHGRALPQGRTAGRRARGRRLRLRRAAQPRSGRPHADAGVGRSGVVPEGGGADFRREGSALAFEANARRYGCRFATPRARPLHSCAKPIRRASAFRSTRARSFSKTMTPVSWRRLLPTRCTCMSASRTSRRSGRPASTTARLRPRWNDRAIRAGFPSRCAPCPIGRTPCGTPLRSFGQLIRGSSRHEHGRRRRASSRGSAPSCSVPGFMNTRWSSLSSTRASASASSSGASRSSHREPMS